MGLLQSTIVLKAKDLTKAVFDKAKENIKGTGAEAEKGAVGVDKLGVSVKKLSTAERKLALEQKKLENSTEKVALEQKKLDQSTNDLNRAYTQANTSEQKAAIRRKQLANDTRQLSLDSKKLSNEQKQLNITAKKAAIAQKGLEKNTKSLGGILKSTTSRVVAFGAAYLGLNKLKEGFLAILDTGGKFETMKVQLDGLMGSVEGGEAAFTWIKEFTKNTPLQLDGVTKAFVKMKALGLDPMDGTMQKLTDMSSKLGGGQERLEGIILAVGQAWTKGKLQAEEANQLIERGVPVWDLMSKAIGKTTGELQTMATKGQLGREQIKLLIDEIGKSSEGAAAAQMTTWAGIISNLQDTWTTFLSSIAESGSLDYFKDQLTSISETIKVMTADGSLKEWAKSISDGMISVGEAIKSTITFISDYSERLKALGAVYAGVKIAGFISGLISATTAMIAGSAATSAATVATRGFTAALAINPITAFIGALVLMGGVIKDVQESYKDKAAAAADLKKAEAELTEVHRKNIEVITAAKIADKAAAAEKANFANQIDKAVIAGNNLTNAASKLSAEEEKLKDKTGDTSKAIKKLSDEAIAGLLGQISKVNQSDIFIGGGWDDLKNDLMHEKFKRLGVDIDVVTGKATKSGASAASAFSEFARSTDNSAESVSRLAQELISAAKTEGDIRLLKQSFEAVGFEIEKHPQLIQNIIKKHAELGGSLDDIPQKWKDIAKAAKDTEDTIKSSNDNLITSDNKRHKNRLNNISAEEAAYIAAVQRQAEADKKAYEDKEKRRLAPVFNAFDKETSESYSGLNSQSLALLQKAQAEDSARPIHTFDSAAFVKILLERQNSNAGTAASVNVNFKANDKSATANFNDQQSADDFIDILKTAGSVT